MLIAHDHLETFLVFAEEQNLSRAAKRLHLSQPAVHAQIKALGEDLGVTLYQRAGRGLALTKEGVEVSAFARETRERSSDLRARLKGEAAGPLVLAAGAGAIVHLLADSLRRRKVEILTADAPSAVDLVRRGIAHLGVGVIEPPGELTSVVIARARQLVVMRRDHRLARKRTLVAKDLTGEPLIMPPPGGPQRATLDAVLGSETAVAVARGWDVVLKLAEIGVGLGIVNETCAIPRLLVARPLRELPVVTYRAFHRPRPRADVLDLVGSLKATRS